MSIPSIKQLKNLAGKRVLVRVDFNVPIKKGKVMEDSRLHASLPTIEYLLSKKAQVILATHVGRPDGKKDPALSVKPIARCLSQLLSTPVKVIEFGIWNIESRKKPNSKFQIPNSSLVMLENIRFNPGEEKNDPQFSKELASIADIFVLDGFAVAHRAAASVVGVTKFLPSYAGLLLEQEISGLEKVMKKPKSPFVLILGGAKMETKVPIMKNLLPRVDHLLIGGGILNTYLKAAGYKVGDSLVDDKHKSDALAIGKKKKVVLPHDVIVGKRDGSGARHVMIEKHPHQICKKGEEILDIGPATIRLYSSYMRKAATLLWNGAMGYFEQKPYDTGTLSIARLLASRAKGRAYGVIGGGETVQAMDMVKMGECVDLVSTGGGAMLEYLGGKKLPGIVALTKAKRK